MSRVIVHAPPMRITRAAAEERLMRALLTLRAPGVVRLPDQRAKSTWPATLVEWSDLVSRAELDDIPPTHETFKPRPRDIDDMLTALSWFSALDPPDKRHPRAKAWAFNRLQKVIWWRSFEPPFSWRWIGERIGRSYETARQWHGEAIDDIWRIANDLA